MNSSIAKRFGFLLKKHSPVILTGIGVIGLISSGVLAVRSTPKALKLIEDKKVCEQKEKLTVTETVKTAWRCYIPSALICVFSVICIAGAGSIQIQRRSALAAACAISESAFKDYRKKVVDTIGEKKESEIKDSLAKQELESFPLRSQEIFITEKGNSLCYDILSGRYFRSDIEKIRKIENELNQRMLSEMYISLNELYFEMGLPNIRLGDLLGWNIEKGFISFEFSAQLAEDGTPCLVIGHSLAPQYEYN